MKDRILPDHWHYRPGWDWGIFDCVVIHNEYEIPNPVPPPGLVVDIGAHIGSFCWAAYLCGARRYVAFELVGANYDLLRDNLAPLGEGASLHHAAVWHQYDETPLFEPLELPENTGGCNVYGAGPSARKIGIDDALRLARDFAGTETISILKIDAEGSEFPILVDADLAGVQMLALEVHDGFEWQGKRWTAHDLVPLLNARGYRQKIIQTGEHLWHIWGYR